MSPHCIIGVKRKKYYKFLLDKLLFPAGVNPNSRKIPLSNKVVCDIFVFSGTPSEFKDVFNVSVTVARNIKNKKTYKLVTEDLTTPGEVITYKLTEGQRREIINSDLFSLILAKMYNVNDQTIRNIKKRK